MSTSAPLLPLAAHAILHVDPMLLAGGMKMMIPQFASAIRTMQGMLMLDVVSSLAAIQAQIKIDLLYQ